MNKQPLIFGVILLVICVGLCGCFDEDTSGLQKSNNSLLNKFVGTWTTEQGVTLVIYTGGTCRFIGSSGTWEINNGTLFIILVYFFCFFTADDNRNISSHFRFNFTTHQPLIFVSGLLEFFCKFNYRVCITK